tara:strand:- start:92 stop:280 length:189 start_codon:yes stop_codon:yes gene_type:complete
MAKEFFKSKAKASGVLKITKKNKKLVAANSATKSAQKTSTPFSRKKKLQESRPPKLKASVNY